MPCLAKWCVSVFSLFILQLAVVSARAYGGEPSQVAPTKKAATKPAPGGDDPFGDETPLPAAVKKPAADVDDPFGGDSSGPAVAKKLVKDAERTAKKPAEAVKPGQASDFKAKPKTAHKLHGGEKAILKALKRKVSLDFTETPLQDVIAFLSEKGHIPIVRDAAGLKDAGVDPECPITCKLSGISLQSALEIILDELQLKWAIHHDVLMITSPQKAESDEFMETKIYDVADLVLPIPDTSIRGTPLSTVDAVHLDMMVRGTAPGQPLFIGGGFGSGVVPVVGMTTAPPAAVAANVGSAPRSVPPYAPIYATGADFKPLMDLIQNTVSTKSWIDNGGNGTISEFPTTLSLVISQTREVHQQIEELLATVRARERNEPAFHVELHWLWLDAAHRDALLTPGKKAAKNALQAIDPQRLLQIAREVPGFHARTNCLNGQEGTLSVGDRRLLVVSAIPVVNGGAAYQPVVSMPNVGVTASVQPILLPGSNLVRLTVKSSITRWTPKRGARNCRRRLGTGKPCRRGRIAIAGNFSGDFIAPGYGRNGHGWHGHGQYGRWLHAGSD